MITTAIAIVTNVVMVAVAIPTVRPMLMPLSPGNVGLESEVLQLGSSTKSPASFRIVQPNRDKTCSNAHTFSTLLLSNLTWFNI